jgi:hypothetical protein
MAHRHRNLCAADGISPLGDNVYAVDKKTLAPGWPEPSFGFGTNNGSTIHAKKRGIVSLLTGDADVPLPSYFRGCWMIFSAGAFVFTTVGV